jgi:cytochrome c
MRKILLLVVVVMAFIKCQTTPAKPSESTTTAVTKEIEPPKAQNVLSEAEKQEGWTLLFDGKSFAGWRNFKKTTIGPDWVVDSTEQAMYLAVKQKKDGQWFADGGDIMTEKAYENYEMQLDWKIDTCGNSGIMYNIMETPKSQYVWHTGPEMQVLDNACHPDAKIVSHRAGDLYDLQVSSQETVKKALEWNHVKLVVNKGMVEHWLNDVKVVEYDMNTPVWKAMIAKSKFKDMADFGKSMKGHIALQDHGNKVWYRNVKIRDIK